MSERNRVCVTSELVLKFGTVGTGTGSSDPGALEVGTGKFGTGYVWFEVGNVTASPEPASTSELKQGVRSTEHMLEMSNTPPNQCYPLYTVTRTKSHVNRGTRIAKEKVCSVTSTTTYPTRRYHPTRTQECGQRLQQLHSCHCNVTHDTRNRQRCHCRPHHAAASHPANMQAIFVLSVPWPLPVPTSIGPGPGSRHQVPG